MAVIPRKEWGQDRSYHNCFLSAVLLSSQQERWVRNRPDGCLHSRHKIKQSPCYRSSLFLSVICFLPTLFTHPFSFLYLLAPYPSLPTSYFHILPNLQIFSFLPQAYVVEKLSLVFILAYKDSCIFSSSWSQGLKVNLTALHNKVDKMCSFFVLHKASQDTSCCLTMLLSALQKVTSRTDKAFGRRFVPDPSPSNQLPMAH